jgi:hypothetical protein
MSRISSCICVFALLACVVGGQEARAQCQAANPSFELGDGGGNVFGGWEQFGVVGSSSVATHGAVSARVTGPNWGGWDVSGYWQQFPASPADSFVASARGWHTATNPLTGQSSAILNIEWRNSAGELISYESFQVANAGTPLDEIQDFSKMSGPAPSGTVAVRLLLGVLQSPTDPPPDFYYDEATFYSAGPPTQDDVQWNDFPGGRSFSFSGYTWRVKGPGYYGPGPNSFCDSPGCTWVDVDGRMHMTIQKLGGTWYSTEVVLEEALGYGDYIFTTYGRLDDLHANAVLGLFLWEYGQCWDPAYLWWNPYNEIDIEFSRWSDPENSVGQFVAQPYDYPGNINRFDATFSEGEITSHAFRWLSDRVEYRSWRGGPGDEAPANLIHSWTYEGPHIPRPDQPRVHVNLWQVNGPPDVNQEVVFDQFTFIPDGIASAVPERSQARTYLSEARPNPFNPVTTIGYTVPGDGLVEIKVYDISGRLVRALVTGFATAGDHEVLWDGRDDRGHPVASGVYLYRFRTGRVAETRKMVLLK